MRAELKCPNCKGKKMVFGLPRPGQKPDTTVGDEPLIVAPCPVCNRGAQQEYLERICGLTPEMRAWTYANTTETAANSGAYQYGKALAARPERFYTLSGPFGTGKTRLLACLVNAGRAAGWTSVYMTTAELFEHLRGAYAPGAPQTFDSLWDRVSNARILALDECDRFNPTAWATEKWYELVEERYRLGADHCTAFATNARIDDLDGYLSSRMYDRRGRVFEMGGGDWRL